MRVSLGTIYVIVGVVVAAMHDYFDNLSTVKLILEAIVAVIIWPFVLAGVEVNFK
jgi:hypothetical protein